MTEECEDCGEDQRTGGWESRILCVECDLRVCPYCAHHWHRLADGCARCRRRTTYQDDTD